MPKVIARSLCAPPYGTPSGPAPGGGGPLRILPLEPRPGFPALGQIVAEHAQAPLDPVSLDIVIPRAPGGRSLLQGGDLRLARRECSFHGRIEILIFHGTSVARR